MPIRGVGRAAKRCYSLPLADARELPDAMEHCSNRDATGRAASTRLALALPIEPFSVSSDSADGVLLSGRTRTLKFPLKFLDSPKINLFKADSAIDATARQVKLFAQRRPFIPGIDLKE